MNVQATKVSRIPTAAVTGLIVDAMIKAGVPAADAAKIAELMLEADLIGADAHGVFRLPQYVQRLKLGSTNARPNIKVNRTAPATALVDGDNGMGHLVVSRTAEIAIEMARECGVAWVGCRMSGHAGAAGVYAALPLKADMIGIYSAVANANHMPLAGGAEPLLGTNPLAIAIPAGEEPPLVLDIATSIVSYGTIKNHKLLNRPLHDDWMIDPKTGEPVTDPHKSVEALLLPMAGYKGAGLALMFGLLAGTLNGALFGRDCVDFNAAPDRSPIPASSCWRSIRRASSRSSSSRRKSIATSANCAIPRRCRAKAVRLPGDQRAKRRADRLRNGLMLPPELLTQLDKLAAELSIKPLRGALRQARKRPRALAYSAKPNPAGRLSWLRPSSNRNVRSAIGRSRSRRCIRCSAARSPASRLSRRCRPRSSPRSTRPSSTTS